MACGNDADLVGQNGAARGAYARHAAVLAQNPGHFAVLDDVHAKAVRGAGVTPCYSVVARRAAAALQRGAHHRVARRSRDVDDRTELLDLFWREPLAVDAVQPVGFDAASALAHVAKIVREVEYTTLAEHEVNIQFLV